MKFLLFPLLLLCSYLQAYQYEVAIVSMFRNTAPYLKEWVEYHKMIGVSHFWLYNDASTDDWEEVLEPYIKEGTVEVFYWPAGKPNWVPEQLSAYLDGIRRAQGVAKWLAMMDQDEFILPREEKSLPDCLREHFSHAGGVYLSWRNFGTSGVTLKSGETILNRLTACSHPSHPFNSCGKSIFQPDQVDPDIFKPSGPFWSPHFCPLKEGQIYVDGDGNATLTISPDRSNLETNGKPHTAWIRMNHYIHIDENFFRNVKLPRSAPTEHWVILEQYKAFNMVRDYEILKFIRTYYPEKFNTIWRK